MTEPTFTCTIGLHNTANLSLEEQAQYADGVWIHQQVLKKGANEF